MLYNIIILEFSILFYMIYDCVTVTCDSYIWYYAITLTLSPEYKNKWKWKWEWKIK